MMFPWFDMLLGLIILRQGIWGFLHGFRSGCIRLCVFVAALAVSLPFATNTSLYLQPVVEPVIKKAIEEKAVPVATAPSYYQFLGPWQDVVGIPAVTGTDLILEKLISLGLNMAGFVFLVVILVLVHRLVERPKISGEPNLLGVVSGLAGGVLMVLVILTTAPIIALGEKGDLLASALEGSMAAKMLGPLVRAMIVVIAPFVH